jgi:hypothetical protein
METAPGTCIFGSFFRNFTVVSLVYLDQVHQAGQSLHSSVASSGVAISTTRCTHSSQSLTFSDSFFRLYDAQCRRRGGTRQDHLHYRLLLQACDHSLGANRSDHRLHSVASSGVAIRALRSRSDVDLHLRFSIASSGMQSVHEAADTTSFGDLALSSGFFRRGDMES